MKKVSRKSLVLFAGVMAVCAFVMPSMASALAWAPLGGADHTLTSQNLSFQSEGAAAIGSSCAQSDLTAVVNAGTVATITATSFTNCMGILGAVPCTATPVGSNFPWTVTPTNPVQIHNVHVVVHLENTPGAAQGCPAPITITLTGTLTGGVFNNVEHGITLAGATGLTGHSAGQLPATVTVSGTIRDSDSASGHQLTLS